MIDYAMHTLNISFRSLNSNLKFFSANISSLQKSTNFFLKQEISSLAAGINELNRQCLQKLFCDSKRIIEK